MILEISVIDERLVETLMEEEEQEEQEEEEERRREKEREGEKERRCIREEYDMSASTG